MHTAAWGLIQMPTIFPNSARLLILAIHLHLIFCEWRVRRLDSEPPLIPLSYEIVVDHDQAVGFESAQAAFHVAANRYEAAEPLSDDDAAACTQIRREAFSEMLRQLEVQQHCRMRGFGVFGVYANISHAWALVLGIYMPAILISVSLRLCFRKMMVARSA